MARTKEMLFMSLDKTAGATGPEHWYLLTLVPTRLAPSLLQAIRYPIESRH
jgi:hypothetical protein